MVHKSEQPSGSLCLASLRPCGTFKWRPVQIKPITGHETDFTLAPEEASPSNPFPLFFRRVICHFECFTPNISLKYLQFFQMKILLRFPAIFQPFCLPPTLPPPSHSAVTMATGDVTGDIALAPPPSSGGSGKQSPQHGPPSSRSIWPC